MCEYSKMQTEHIREALARELLLGNDAHAADIFATYQRRLKQGAPMAEAVLVRGVDSRDSVGQGFECHVSQGFGTVSYALPLTFAGEKLGAVRGTIENTSLQKLLGFIALTSLLSLGLVLRLQASIRRDLHRRVVRPLQRLSRGEGNEQEGLALREVHEIASDLDRLRERIAAAERQRCEAEKEASLGELAAQVAHDIRSPLAALNMLLGELGRPSEETRVLLRSAVFRIQDIANLLLDKNRSQKVPDAGVDNGLPCATLLSSLVETLVSEKRTQYRPRLQLTIESRNDPSACGLFVGVCPSELKRALSNLINNSVEAISAAGAVVVTLSVDGGKAAIEIRDDGAGIPPEVLAVLGRNHVTHGKRDGNGIGVRHAHSAIEAHGGSLRFESELGIGTTVTITLPCVSPPAWFLEQVVIDGATSVVILDDDVSIHRIWDERFAQNAPDVKLLHFSTADELRRHRRASEADDVSRVDALYLVDYELIEQPVTGLDLIEELQLSSSSVLVTSRFEEQPVVDRCLRLNLKMIPKVVASFVPIVRRSTSAKISGTEPEVVLIDDDALVHQIWRHAAQRAGKRLDVFSGAAEFFLQSDRIPLNASIYVDDRLGGEDRGDTVTKAIYEKGFAIIYLATGSPPSAFDGLYWLSGIQGKEPPF